MSLGRHRNEESPLDVKYPLEASLVTPTCYKYHGEVVCSGIVAFLFQEVAGGAKDHRELKGVSQRG